MKHQFESNFNDCLAPGYCKSRSNLALSWRSASGYAKSNISREHSDWINSVLVCFKIGKYFQSITANNHLEFGFRQVSSECQMYGNRQPGMNVLSLPQLSPLGCAPILADFSGFSLLISAKNKRETCWKLVGLMHIRGVLKVPTEAYPNKQHLLVNKKNSVTSGTISSWLEAANEITGNQSSVACELSRSRVPFNIRYGIL